MKTQQRNKSDAPEFAVTREQFSRLFAPPLKPGTFYDMVKRNQIVPVEGVKRYYLLNQSLRNLGMKPFKNLEDLPGHQARLRETVELAVHKAWPERVPYPMAFALAEPAEEQRQHAQALSIVYRQGAEGLEDWEIPFFIAGVQESCVITERLQMEDQ